MKKLKLEIDALAVESFDIEVTGAVAGTVEGRAETLLCNTRRICLPDDPSYETCNSPSCGLQCTSSCQNSECYNGQTCTC